MSTVHLLTELIVFIRLQDNNGDADMVVSVERISAARTCKMLLGSESELEASVLVESLMSQHGGGGDLELGDEKDLGWAY